jgi:hypothetical protein
MTCWQLLGLAPTEDVKDIKRAYARLLKDTHPEDDPAGFQRLRAAYEQALAAAPYVNETFDEYEEDQEEEIQEIQEIQPTDPYTYDTLPPTPIAQPVQPKPAEPNPWQDLIEEDQRYAQEKSVALWLLAPHQIAPALQNVLKEVRGLSFKEDFLSAFWQHAADRFEEAPWRSLEALYPLVKDDESLLDDTPWQVNQWFSAIRTESNIQQDLKVGLSWRNWNTWNSESSWANFCLKLMIGQPPAWWLWLLGWLPNVRKWVQYHLDHYERREPAFYQKVLEPRLPALQPLLSGPVLSSFDVLLAFYPIARYVWLPMLKVFDKLEGTLPVPVILSSVLLLLVALTAVGAGALATFRWRAEDRLASNTLVARAESQPAWTAVGYFTLAMLPWWLPAGFWPLSAALLVLALFWLTRHFSLVTVLALGFIAWACSFFMLDAGQTDQNVLSFFPWFLGLSTVFAHLLLPPAPVAGEKRSVEINTLFLHWFLTGTFSLLASFLIKRVLY